MIISRIIFAITWFTLSISSFAKNSATIIWSDAHVAAGETINVSIHLKDIEPVYGVQFSASYDTKVMQFINDVPASTGAKIQLGQFFDTQRAFSAKNSADVSSGKIQLIHTLLSPARPVSGDGILLNIRFKTQKEGPATFNIHELKFGKQDGTVVTPELISANIIPSISAATSYRSNETYIWISAGVIFILTCTLGYFITRKPSHKLKYREKVFVNRQLDPH